MSRFYRQKKGHATSTQTGSVKKGKTITSNQKSSSRTNHQSFQKESQSAGQKWENDSKQQLYIQSQRKVTTAKQSQKGQNLHIKENSISLGKRKRSEFLEGRLSSPKKDTKKDNISGAKDRKATTEKLTVKSPARSPAKPIYDTVSHRSRKRNVR